MLIICQITMKIYSCKGNVHLASPGKCPGWRDAGSATVRFTHYMYLESIYFFKFSKKIEFGTNYGENLKKYENFWTFTSCTVQFVEKTREKYATFATWTWLWERAIRIVSKWTNSHHLGSLKQLIQKLLYLWNPSPCCGLVKFALF
jgi:hypothetical protein